MTDHPNSLSRTRPVERAATTASGFDANIVCLDPVARREVSSFVVHRGDSGSIMAEAAADFERGPITTPRAS
jgi:hypothetical protein